MIFLLSQRVNYEAYQGSLRHCALILASKCSDLQSLQCAQPLPIGHHHGVDPVNANKLSNQVQKFTYFNWYKPQLAVSANLKQFLIHSAPSTCHRSFDVCETSLFLPPRTVQSNARWAREICQTCPRALTHSASTPSSLARNRANNKLLYWGKKLSSYEEIK